MEIDRIARIDLMPVFRREARRRQRRMRYWIAVIGACSILLVLAWTAGRTSQAQQANAVAEMRHAATDELSRSRREIGQLRGVLAEAQEHLITATIVQNQPDWSVLLTALAEHLGDDVVLDRCTLLPPDSPKNRRPANAASGKKNLAGQWFTLELGGFARRQSSVTSFALRLEKTGLFDRVDFVGTSEQTFGKSKAIAFTLKCLLGEKERDSR